MTRTLVLHLGDHKTGSTSIQQALASGRIYTSPVSVCFPMGTPKRSHHNHIVRGLIRETRGAENDAPFSTLAAEIGAAAADVTILSAEAFERADPKLVREALQRFLPDLASEARLIVYIRPHAERLVSTFAERIKQGLFIGDITAFFQTAMAEEMFLYAPRMQRWRAVFGDRLTVRPMIRERLKNSDVVEDFMDFALQGAPFQLPQAAPSNEKVAMADLSLLCALQSALPEQRGDVDSPKREPARALGWRLARMMGAGGAANPAGNAPASSRPASPRPALHRALAAEVVAAYAADAAEMDQKFFGGADLLAQALAQAPDTAVDQPQSIRLEDHFSGEALRLQKAFIKLVTQIYALHPEDWRAHFQRNPLRLSTVEDD